MTTALIGIVKKQCTQNINLTMKDHDPSYERYTFYGHINNADGAKIPVKILRDTGSLISLISSECAELCDYVKTNETTLIKGITAEVIEISVIQVDFCSNLINGVIKVGIHDHCPPGCDCLIGIELAHQKDSRRLIKPLQIRCLL